MMIFNKCDNHEGTLKRQVCEEVSLPFFYMHTQLTKRKNI